MNFNMDIKQLQKLDFFTAITIPFRLAVAICFASVIVPFFIIILLFCPRNALETALEAFKGGMNFVIYGIREEKNDCDF